MKKTYNAPVTKVMEMNTEELICMSIQNGKATNNAVLVRQRGSRTYSIIDDSEDEE